MGRLGRERCLRRFDIDATVAQIDGLYRAALGQSTRRATRTMRPACR